MRLQSVCQRRWQPSEGLTGAGESDVKLTHVAIGKSLQFLCYVGLSTGLLITWKVAFLSMSDPSKRESEQDGSNSVFCKLISGVT